MAQKENCDKDGEKAQKLLVQTLFILSPYLKISVKRRSNISYGCVAHTLFGLLFYSNTTEINL